jgi:virulence factor Mce-like protein
MIKQIPSPGNIAAMVLFALTCFCLTLFLWVSFGGPVPFEPKGYRVTAVFREATQLATEADVRISGVTVGTVKEVNAMEGRTEAVLELDERYAPLPADVRSTLRLKTLLGETFIELTPGTNSPEVPKIPEGGTLDQGKTEELVQLDEVIRIFDPTTREALVTWLEQQALALKDSGDDLNEALATLPIFFAEGRNALEIFEQQHDDTKKLISASADVFEAIDSRPGQLTELVVEANRLLTVTANRNEQLTQIWREFPGFIRAAKAATIRFSEFSENTGPFVERTTEIAEEFAPLLKQSVDATTDARGIIEKTDPVLDRADTALPYINEFLDLSRPLLAQSDPFLRNLNPLLEFLGLYRAEITGALANSAAATQSRVRGNDNSPYGHILRIFANVSPMANTYSASRFDKSRGNAYPVTGWYNTLSTGLRVFDAAHCAGIPVPTLDPDTSKYDAAFPGTTNFRDLLEKYLYNGDDTAPLAAPACLDQGPFQFQGQTLYYPHVRENSTP